MNTHSRIPQLKFESRKKTRPTLTEKPPTLSYSQMKVEVSALQVQNAELKQKLTKHQNSAHSSKTAVKELQKENRELKHRLEEEECQHKDSMTACQGELVSKTDFLETKLRNCEEALEKSDINPVTLAALEHDQELRRQSHADATRKAIVLREMLEENINTSHSNIADMKTISEQCQAMMRTGSGQMEAS